MGKFFNKGLEEEDKKEGLLKRLKNIEDKNEQQLKIIKSKTENIKEVTDFAEETLSPKARDLVEEIKIIQKDVDYKKLKTTGDNNVTYDFSNCKTFNELFNDLYLEKMTINEAQMKQDELNSVLAVLSNYTPRNKKIYLNKKWSVK